MNMNTKKAAALLAPALTYEPLARALMLAASIAGQQAYDDPKVERLMSDLYETVEKLRLATDTTAR